MTDRTLQLYNSNRVYYSLERDIAGVSSASGSTPDYDSTRTEVNGGGSGVARIDNPDQRITEDVRTFTAFSLQLFITVVTSVIDLVSFSLILYSIQPQLFATIIVYAMFGTFTTVYIGRCKFAHCVKNPTGSTKRVAERVCDIFRKNNTLTCLLFTQCSPPAIEL